MWRMWDGTWLALAVFSAPALKCRARDSWVGWDFRYQYGRLHLVSNNSRLLILPGHHYRNLGSRFLGLCARRIVGDWPARFGHPLLLLETFVDPARFQGTVYRAANWQAVGHSRGFRRGGAGYCELSTPKRVFLYPPCPERGPAIVRRGARSNPAQRSAEDHSYVQNLLQKGFDHVAECCRGHGWRVDIRYRSAGHAQPPSGGLLHQLAFVLRQ